MDRRVDSRGLSSPTPRPRLDEAEQIAGQTNDGDDPTELVARQSKAALGRIDMPPDAVERIAELLTPGSSLIVSDYGLSRETGYDTDFIVETH